MKNKNQYPYIALIAGNRYSTAFDRAHGMTAASAIAAVKRRNSPDWKDCFVWAISNANYTIEQKKKAGK